MIAPTPYSDVNVFLEELLAGVRGVLGARFVGMYLDGSLVTGAFDSASDIDFVVVPDEPVDAATFAALSALHKRLASHDNPFATDLEGSYLPRDALRRHDLTRTRHPNLERGRNERLKWAEHGKEWDIHRWLLRERGITVTGPPPADLIGPVSPDDLRAAMRDLLPNWAAYFRQEPTALSSRGYQSYVVLSLCRVAYTLQEGGVVSKLHAASWAQEMWGAPRAALIARALTNRHGPGGAADAADVHATLALLHDIGEQSRAEHTEAR